MEIPEKWKVGYDEDLEGVLNSLGHYEAARGEAEARVTQRMAVTLLCPRCGRRLADARWEPGMPGDFWVSNLNYTSSRQRYKSEVTVYTLRDGVTTKVRIKCHCALDIQMPLDALIRIYVDAVEHHRDRVSLPAPSAV